MSPVDGEEPGDQMNIVFSPASVGVAELLVEVHGQQHVELLVHVDGAVRVHGTVLVQRHVAALQAHAPVLARAGLALRNVCLAVLAWNY